MVVAICFGLVFQEIGCLLLLLVVVLLFFGQLFAEIVLFLPFLHFFVAVLWVSVCVLIFWFFCSSHSSNMVGCTEMFLNDPVQKKKVQFNIFCFGMLVPFQPAKKKFINRGCT